MSESTSPQSLVQLIDQISKVFLGKEEVIRQATLALISGGHILLEDAPGLGKTLLAKTFAQSIHADFKRIQFTADLLPSDISGVTVYSQETHDFSFRKGPIFTNILLGDEINRATPRTQSSLLEAMEEEHVTIDGTVYPLVAPFFVMATQNPVELEGTYPLPFAQMDRFILRLSIGYLDKEGEKQVLRSQRSEDPLNSVQPVMHKEDLVRIQSEVRQVRMEENVLDYLIEIIHATRSTPDLAYGASPRGSLDLQRFSQAIAYLEGRDYTLPDDVKQAALATLPHRLIIKKGSRTVSLGARSVVERLIQEVPAPL